MEQEVEQVITGGMAGVAQNGVVEEERKSGEGAVKAVLGVRIPVMPGENGYQVGGRRGVDAPVFQDEAAGIKHEAEAERIRVGCQGEGGEAGAHSPEVLGRCQSKPV